MQIAQQSTLQRGLRWLQVEHCVYTSELWGAPGDLSRLKGPQPSRTHPGPTELELPLGSSSKQQAAAPVSKCHSPQKAGAWMEVNEGERALWGPDPSALPSNQSKACMTPDHDLNSAAASGCNLETPTLHSR